MIAHLGSALCYVADDGVVSSDLNHVVDVAGRLQVLPDGVVDLFRSNERRFR